MLIYNKLQSIAAINGLGLNKFPEKLFNKGETEEVKDFIEKYPAKFYAIRDKSKAGGVFKLKVLAEEVLTEIEGYDLFTVNVSSANYADNQILVGELEVLSNNKIYAILSTDKTASVRDAIKNPTYNLNTDIFDNRLNHIFGFDFMYQYIIDHGLKDIIVEFSLFDIKVGTLNEREVIYELRTNY